MVHESWNCPIFTPVRDNPISAEKLIILKPTDGWEPICKLLNVPIPTVPYPSLNNRKEFLADKNQWRSEAPQK